MGKDTSLMENRTQRRQPDKMPNIEWGRYGKHLTPMVRLDKILDGDRIGYKDDLYNWVSR